MAFADRVSSSVLRACWYPRPAASSGPAFRGSAQQPPGEPGRGDSPANGGFHPFC